MYTFQRSIGREAAVTLFDSKWWEGKTTHEANREIAIFQMEVAELCMPFERFHEAVEIALGRPVFTHEFGLNAEGIYKELVGTGPAPSFDDIMNLIPADKRIVIVAGEG